MRTSTNQVVNKNERIALHGCSGFRFMKALDGTASAFPILAKVRLQSGADYLFVVREGETYKFGDKDIVSEIQIDFSDATVNSKYDIDILGPGDLIWKGM